MVPCGRPYKGYVCFTFKINETGLSENMIFQLSRERLSEGRNGRNYGEHICVRI